MPFPRLSPVAEAVAAFAIATLVCAALYALRNVHPFVASNLAIGMALVFWFLPLWLLERAGRDPRAYGLRLRPFIRHISWALGAMVIVFPLFLGGFYLFYNAVCSTLGPPMCARFLPWQWRLPPGLARLALAQVILIGFPEEWFFRGYLQGRLAETLPTWKAILASSALFGLGHFLVDFQPSRLAVFFPGLLFGILRERTGSIAPGALFHAACNIYMEVLYRSFFF